MANNFTNAFQIILNWEGGYSNDPDDPGGETKYGISKKIYPDLNIHDLTVEDVAAIYMRDYWDALQCGNMPYPVALMVFDTAINQGQKNAAMMLQSVLHVQIDGVIGNQTIAACNTVPIDKILKDFTTNRILRYMGISNFDKYGRGWINRTVDIFQRACKYE